MGNRVKPIPSEPGYFAGEDGTIYSAWEGRGHLAKIGGELKPLKTTAAPDGRCQVNPRGKSRRVSRLVLEAFVGPCPEGMEACHFPDRDTRNNRLENLRWDTPRSNQADRKIHGTSNAGERNGSARLTEAQVTEIRRRREDGEPVLLLAQEFGVAQVTVRAIVSRRIWKTVA